jgi:superfamily I DNA/RNA helicase
MATKIMLTREEIFAIQESERNARLQAILDSDAPKKIIVAGAGTGKTYTFERLLKLMPKGNNLVLTFINKLKDDMHSKLGEMSKVQTFHEFSIGRLRSLKYELSIYPKIYTIIESDSDNRISGISEHFQKLDWDEGQLNYCLARMNYYKTHGFDDALYLLLENIRLGKVRFKEYDIILIDEFQDFNALEVALIKELEKHGNIVIVGDDEQALYDFRNASPVFLREFYQRENFEKFSLPFCSRCPDVIVKSLKDVVSVAESNGYLNGHIPREYECFSKDKEVENKRYPHIKHIRLVESWTIPQFIKNQIEKYLKTISKIQEK